jgi:hypothetical protein
MYIKDVHLKNLKSLKNLHLYFEEGKEAGWHIILGDNGSGKTSTIRAIALGLIGPSDYKGLRVDLKNWITDGEKETEIGLHLHRDYDHDWVIGSGRGKKRTPLWAILHIKPAASKGSIDRETFVVETPTEDANAMIWGNRGGWFSAGFGPFRRFTGGDPEVVRIYASVPRAAAHVSMFGENVAFQEALLWLKDLHNSKQDGKEIEGRLLDLFIAFVNQTQLLPHDTRIKEITNEGVFFEDGNGVLVHISNLSDGFRSMLSLMFELLRQLLRVYQMDVLFANADQELFSIDLPGVVLIDEVDAHLHPTWQTRIGEWFTKYFPNIQFIVTTHSPLICRAAENGTIWRLPAPGSDEKPQEVTGLDRKRLIYGDILDAYGTELFGEDISVSQSEETKRLHERMLKLQRMSMDGLTSDDEETELDELRSFL